MSHLAEYTTTERLVLEVNILLGLYDLDLKAGEHYSGMREYQRTRVEELLTEIAEAAAEAREPYKPDPTLPGCALKGAVHLSHDPNDYAPWEDAA